MKFSLTDFDALFHSIKNDKVSYLVLSCPGFEREVKAYNATYHFNRHGKLVWIEGF